MWCRCATSSPARECGLDVIAITDQQQRRRRPRGPRARRSVRRAGDHRRSPAAEGEVVGLFLEQTIPGGMSFAEGPSRPWSRTASSAVPHPFDHLHTVPSYAISQAARAGHRRRRGVQLAARFPGLQRTGRAVRGALPHPGGRRKRRSRACRAWVRPDGHGVVSTSRTDFLDALAGAGSSAVPRATSISRGSSSSSTSFDGGAGRRELRGAFCRRGRGWGRRRSLRGAGSSSKDEESPSAEK